MPIQEGDIQILASQVLADVPEGGGAATGQQIVDGQSNNLFPDVSELDRVYGDVSLRKVFVGVRTQDTDTYFGAHVIVAEPPQDPDVSAVLFSTGDSFDRRAAAAGRIESYLALGPLNRGLLYGNHIAGQMTVMLIQRVGTALPVVGDTLVLRKGEGTGSQVEQFVRVTDVSSEVMSFTNPAAQTTDFQRQVVTLGISDQLRADFPGFTASEAYYDASVNFVGKTKVYDTLVADAARYYGITPLASPAPFGAVTVQAQSIFTRLVPSSRAETPIADARMNQQVGALVAAADQPVVQTITMAFTTTQQMFVGGGILPGSLSVVRGSVTLADRGGRLVNGDIEVGTVDYVNGVLGLSSNVFGTDPGSHTVTYTPAAQPAVVSESIGLPVTQASQRLTWVVTLDPLPARASLQVSYASGGRWYVLQEDGSGAIRGADSGLGAGTLNYETGTVTLTLGAMPDVGSRIILTWAPRVVAPRTSPVSLSGGGSRFVMRIDTGESIDPGSVSLTWNDGQSRSATDAAGQLTGDASGRVSYGAGLIEFAPHVLPTPGTSVTVSVSRATQQRQEINAFSDGGATWTATIPDAPIKPRSLRVSVVAQHPVRIYPGIDEVQSFTLLASDDGAGNLRIGASTVGTVDYTTGQISLQKSVSNFTTTQGQWANRTPLGGANDPSYIVYLGSSPRQVTLSILNGPPSSGTVHPPPQQWWTGPQAVAAHVEFAGGTGSVHSTVLAMDELVLSVPLAVGYVLAAGTRFRLGDLVSGQLHSTTPTGDVVRQVVGAGGGAVTVGHVTPALGEIVLTDWTAGVSSTVQEWAGVQAPPVAGVNTPLLADAVTFRTATAPVANQGFSVTGTFGDGASFNVTADADGNINGSGVVGKINYDSGVVELRFIRSLRLGGGDPGVLDLSYLGVAGVAWAEMRQVRADSLRYNAVAYDYLPLDASILGLDPVRLPSDGRVPIFRKGSVAVVHHTDITAPQTVSNGQTVSLGRTRIARADVIGADGQPIESGYTVDRIAGTVTFTDVTGYSQPVRIRHRIEDAALVADAQISGLIRFTRPMTHDYPLGSYVSSALLINDMRARVPLLFDQATWTGVWSDDPIGSGASATYDAINNPPMVDNESAITERWAMVFTGSTNFNIVGEHVGQIGSGNTAQECAPLNPNTGRPYFRLAAAGFGAGWAAGNVIRLNTVGALAPVWVARVVAQGQPTALDDSFRLLVRGDVDTP